MSEHLGYQDVNKPIRASFCQCSYLHKMRASLFWGNYENTHFPLVFCHFFQVYSAAIKFLHPWMEFCSFFGYNIVSLWVTNSSLSLEKFLVYLFVHEQTNYIYVYVKVKWLSRVWLFATPWAVAYQVPPSTGFSRQEYWSGLPFPSPGDLANPGIEPGLHTHTRIHKHI